MKLNDFGAQHTAYAHVYPIVVQNSDTSRDWTISSTFWVDTVELSNLVIGRLLSVNWTTSHFHGILVFRACFGGDYFYRMDHHRLTTGEKIKLLLKCIFSSLVPTVMVMVKFYIILINISKSFIGFKHVTIPL